MTVLFLVFPKGALADSPAADDPWHRLQQRLSTATTLHVDRAPLGEVLHLISRQSGVAILIDVRGLDDFGLALDDPVSVAAESVPLETLLDHLLSELDLDWTVRGEVLVVTSEERAQYHCVTRVYDVADLRHDAGDYPDYDELIDAIVSTIDADTWVTNGGRTADIRPLANSNALVICQTPRNHWKIEKLLADIREVRERQGLPSTPSSPQGTSETSSTGPHKTYFESPAASQLPRAYR